MRRLQEVNQDVLELYEKEIPGLSVEVYSVLVALAVAVAENEKLLTAPLRKGVKSALDLFYGEKKQVKLK